MRRRLAVPAMVAILAGCTGQANEDPAAPSPTPNATVASSADPPATASAPQEAVLIAAGDIAGCEDETDEETADLVETLEGTVATLGDNVYPEGSDRAYADCFGPSWGRFRPDRLRPAIGNHDNDDDGAAYFRYFGELAGNAGEGWYSYDLGAWHVIVLNSNCGDVDCGPGSPQHDWLVDDLAASDAGCTLAYWHHPRFSSGEHGDDPEVALLGGPLRGRCGRDPRRPRPPLRAVRAPGARPGARPGPRHSPVHGRHQGQVALRHRARSPNSEVIINDAFGVLELTLRADDYDWRFLNVDGSEADAGTGECH